MQWLPWRLDGNCIAQEFMGFYNLVSRIENLKKYQKRRQHKVWLCTEVIVTIIQLYNYIYSTIIQLFDMEKEILKGDRGH